MGCGTLGPLYCTDSCTIPMFGLGLIWCHIGNPCSGKLPTFSAQLSGSLLRPGQSLTGGNSCDLLLPMEHSRMYRGKEIRRGL